MACAGNEDDRNFLLHFIKTYKSLPSLWDVSSQDYINRNVKSRDYGILVKVMKTRYPEATKQMVVKKINAMRTSYRRELKKKRESLRVGYGQVEEYIPSLWYFEHLSFLDEQIDNRFVKRSFDEIGNGETLLKKKKKIDSSTDELVRLATERLRTPQDSCHQMGTVWGNKLSKMDRNQRIIAEKLINEVMFNGELGLLNFNTTLTNISTVGNFNASSPLFSKNNSVTDANESSPESPSPQGNYTADNEYDALENIIKPEQEEFE